MNIDKLNIALAEFKQKCKKNEVVLKIFLGRRGKTFFGEKSRGLRKISKVSMWEICIASD